MAFTIHHTPSGYKTYDDSHTLEVKDSGILEVKRDGQQVELLSPAYWTRVTPGEKKSAKPVRIR